MRILALILLFASVAGATTRTASTCNDTGAGNVQATITASSNGDTVNIPAGNCTWSTGVTVSAAITINGAGSPRVIAYDNGTDMITIGTGAKVWNIVGYSPGFSSANISNGQTLLLFEKGNDPAFMQGTVTSLVSGTLTMNITSTGGSGTNHRWLVATVCSTCTVITNSSGTNPLFGVTESTAGHINIGNIQIVPGTYSQNVVHITYTSGGQAVLVHDMWVRGNSNDPGPIGGGNGTVFLSDSPWRGVFWNISCEAYPFSTSSFGCVGVQDKGNTTAGVSWTTVSAWGTNDTTGQQNAYVETSDFHAMGFATSTDDFGRMVSRYNLYDNAGFGTHGADSSFYGQRYFDFYNNVLVYNGYNTPGGSPPENYSFNMNTWFYVRGGTYAVHNNTIQNLTSTDFSGSQTNMNMTEQDLGRPSVSDGCWGANYSTTGQYYHAPRQVGYGYVTGTGTAAYTSIAPNPVYTVSGSMDAYTYVGDSEPGYIWANSIQPLNNVITSDDAGCLGTLDVSSNYIVLNRDYFNGSTAKPGYTPFQYPNPLEGGSASITISPFTLPNGIVGVMYAPSGAFTASGGLPPYTWALNSGTLPAGVTLNSSSGVLAGTPTTVFTYNFVIKVTDSTSGTPLTATQSYSVTIGSVIIPPLPAPNTQFSGNIPLPPTDLRVVSVN